MASKTVLKLLLNRYAPLSVELQKAVAADQSVINQDGSYSYVDNTDAADVTAIPERKTTVGNSILDDTEDENDAVIPVVEAVEQ